MKRSFGVIAVALVASMAVAGLAFAEEADESAEAMMLESVRVQVVEELVGEEIVTTVYVALVSDGLPTDCPKEPAVPADGDGGAAVVPGDIEEGGEDGEGVVEDGPVVYEVGGCIIWEVDHPSGKTHHGAIVSTIAKNVRPSMLDGIKKGEIMRNVAKNGYLPDDFAGLVDDGDGDDDDDGDVEPKTDSDKPARGNSENAKKDKPAKGKKN